MCGNYYRLTLVTMEFSKHILLSIYLITFINHICLYHVVKAINCPCNLESLYGDQFSKRNSTITPQMQEPLTHRNKDSIYMLMESVKMERLVVIYSSKYSLLVYDMLVYSPVPMEIYVINDNLQQYQDIQLSINKTLLEVNQQDKQTHFLLIGDTQFLTVTLQMVNLADEMCDQQGYFTFLHRWLILLHRQHFSELEKHIANIQHLNAISLETAHDSVEIYSAMWKPWGRQFELIGKIFNTPQSVHLHMITDQNTIFPNEKYGFNGQLFKVGSQLWPIYVLVENEYPNGTTYRGSFMDVLDIVSQDLNFTFEIKIAPNGYWGSKINGTWNGIVGLLYSREADVSFAPLAITPQRKTAMDYAEVPVVFDSHVGIYKTPPPLQNTLYLYLKPFQNNVWLTIAISWIGFSLYVCVFILFHNCLFNHRRISFRTFISFTGEVLWCSFTSFFTQNIKIKTTSMSASCLWSAWWLYSLLIILVWSGNIVSFITIKLYPDLIANLDYLTQHDKYKIIVLSSTAIEEAALTSSDPFLRKLGQQILDAREEEPDLLTSDHNTLLLKAKEGGYVYLGDQATLQLDAYNSNCSLNIIPQHIYPYGYYIGMQKNSAYRQMFNKAAIKIHDFGLYNYWAQKYTKTFDDVQCMHKITSNPLELYHVQSMMFCFAAMLAISLFVLGIENIISVITVQLYKKVTN